MTSLILDGYHEESTVPAQLVLLAGVTLPNCLPMLQDLIELGPAHGMDIRQDHRRQLRWLRDLAPEYLLTYATNLEASRT